MTNLPFNFNFDDVEILKALNNANHKLGQLNGAINLLPNPYVIFNAITLGEAKESSEIEKGINVISKDENKAKEILSILKGEKDNSQSSEQINNEEIIKSLDNMTKTITSFSL